MTTATAQPAAGVRPATDTDAPRLATVLARSFATCPAWQWYLPPERNDRLARMERFFAFLLSGIYLRPGRECVTTDDLTGAALWDPPERWKLGTRDNLRMLAVMIRTFRGTAPRAIRGFGALDAGHPSRPHWYLSVLGIDPDTRRSGAAEALIGPGLERCDRERVAAYLETGRPRSRDFFAQHGFEVSDELELPGGGPPVWRMWREPNPNTRQEEPTWPTTTA
jgi:ribosomal protein S18 acetylase RimI-like enzyme